jgi:fructan beta-fructosidase
MSGVVKLIKPGTEICVAEADIKRGVKYNLKVCAKGSNIKVYLDGELKIDADDDSFKSGYFGVGVFAAKALFQNVNAEIKK